MKTVNDQAGIGPVPVDERILSLLQFAQTAWTETAAGSTQPWGSVLALWHDAREQALEDPDRAALPDRSALEEAALHTDLSALELDLEAGTAFLTDPDMALDVGALAKGYAVEQVAAAAPDHFLISVGGNVCATGPKPTARLDRGRGEPRRRRFFVFAVRGGPVRGHQRRLPAVF